jgi:hypothetical protein
MKGIYALAYDDLSISWIWCVIISTYKQTMLFATM